MSKLLRGVTAQLLLLTVLPLTVILAVISFGSISMHQQAMRRLVSERDIRAVAATAGSIGALIQHKTDVLALLAEGAGVIDAEIAREFPGGIILWGANNALTTTNAAATQWARSPDASAVLSMVTQPAGSHVAVWQDALVLHTQDSARAVTAVGLLPLDALRFSALVNPAQGAPPVNAFLFGAEGRALAHTQSGLIGADVRDHPGVAEALRGEIGGLFRPDPSGGDEHVVSYAPIVTSRGPTGLGVIIEEPWETVLDPLMRYSLAMPLVTLPVLLLAMLAVMFGLRRIVQPLQQLDRQAREIGHGHYDVLRQPVRGIEEIGQLQRTLRAMADRIQADQVRLRNYALAVTETQEAERKRLARELHDDTIQSLIVLSQRIQGMRQTVARDQMQSAAKLDDLRSMVLRMIEDVRRFSRALRPIYLEDAGLAAALERLAVEANAGAPACAVTFDIGGQVARLKPEVELALFRIAQEALVNALRHASSTRVSITLSTLPAGNVQLLVEDDGQGFADPDVTTTDQHAHAVPRGAGGGFGLLGIRERALLIGARVDIESAPGQGTRVAVLYPGAA